MPVITPNLSGAKMNENTLRLRHLDTRQGRLNLPAFLPDATRAAVRTIDSRDVRESGIEGLMVNVIHLANHPGVSVIKKQGGIHRFMAWDGPIFSDSGGFQIFSLIDGSPKSGSVSDRGFVYRLARGGNRKTMTPEKSIQKQFQIGADVMFCLDYCTHPQADYSLQERSVELTIEWARKCKREFEQLMEGWEPDSPRPLLFAVIQGGEHKELRQQCARSLLEIGFDGYGYGGWPIDREGHLVEAVEMVADSVPPHLPLHGLGIGKPENIVRAFGMGYDLFDCVLPSRDARHHRLYVFKDKTETIEPAAKDFYDFLYIQDERYVRDFGPVDPYCDCFCCGRYSRAYLHHLLKVEEPLLSRLATVHNLRFFSRLMAMLRQTVVDRA